MMSSSIFFLEACRLYLIIVLVLAAAGKTLAFRRFERELRESFPRIGALGRFPAVMIIVVEWLSAALISMPGEASWIGLMMALALFFVFTVIIAISLIRNESITCSCFGSSSHRISVYDLYRNMIFIGSAMYALLAFADGHAMPAALHATAFAFAMTLFFFSTTMQDIALFLSVKTDE